MKNIVIDCNVYISAFMESETCLNALDKAFTYYNVCYSESTLQELLKTLKKPKLKPFVKEERIQEIFFLLHKLGKPFSPVQHNIKLPDSDDSAYLDLAITANAKYIITGNKKHFPEKSCQGIQILSPSEFIK